MNRKLFFLLLILTMLTTAIITYYNPNLFTRYIFTKAYIPPIGHSYDEKKLKSIYDVNIVLSKPPIGNVNTYLPKYSVLDEETANNCHELFNLNSPLEEFDDYYYSEGDSGKLTIHKYDNFISFTANTDYQNAPRSSITLSSDLEAIEKAVKYVESKFLFLSYEESLVTFDNNIYQIRFINRIGNIKNYAFNTLVNLDQYGNLLSIDYYNMFFEKFTNCKLKSMEDAFGELPTDLPEGTKVDLKKCTLVYVYEESFVQPAYLFEGEFSDGRSYQCFVRASVYTD